MPHPFQLLSYNGNGQFERLSHLRHFHGVFDTVFPCHSFLPNFLDLILGNDLIRQIQIIDRFLDRQFLNLFGGMIHHIRFSVPEDGCNFHAESVGFGRLQIAIIVKIALGFNLLSHHL